MGLAGPKRRTRISHDPNNTQWTRNSKSFGHRILTQQGWTPGAYLGPENAAQASHYTAANASHVRVMLKEDNLGLGAKRNDNAERFGLDMFSGLLGRLNGKEADVQQKEQDTRRDVGLRLWQEGRYGGVRFVSAGYLVGDEIKELRKGQEEGTSKKRKSGGDSRSGEFNTTKDTAKRRKLGVERNREVEKAKVFTEAASISDGAMEEASSRRADESQAGNTTVIAPDTVGEADKASELARTRKKARQRDLEEAVLLDSSDRIAEPTADEPESLRVAERNARRQRRAEKKAKKLEKAARKLAKAERRAAKEKEHGESRAEGEDSVIPQSGQGAPTAAGGVLPGNRFAVRQRSIRHKQMARMDPKALNEILMIKSSA